MFFCFLASFFTYNFNVSWYYTLFCSYSIEMIMLSLYSLTYPAYAVKHASALSTSDSCNKSIFFIPKSNCSILVPVKLACWRSLKTFFWKKIVSRGYNFEWPTQCAVLLLSFKHNVLDDVNVVFFRSLSCYLSYLNYTPWC